MNSKSKFKTIYTLLKQKYGNLHSSLNFTNEVECWAAVILSVQNTDKHINTITPKLFAKYKSFKDYADSSIEEIFEYVKGVNYNKTKAKYLFEGAKIICNVSIEKGESHKVTRGLLSNNLNDLMKLPGVGRKVGNVILSEIMNQVEGIAIDTHNIRVWNRILMDTASPGKLANEVRLKWLKITNNSQGLDPKQLEQVLIDNLDKSTWREISLLVIEHGRNTCKARNPKCEECILRKYCEYYNTQKS